MLSTYDEAILESLLSYGRDEKSPMGAILDRAELYSYHEPEEPRQRPEGHKAHCQCPDCIVREIDVSGVERHEKDPPDTDPARRRAEADRRLRVVRLANPTLARVLVAYHGDSGHKFGRTKWTRLGAVLQFTNAGHKLAEQQAKKETGTRVKRSDSERVAAALELSEVQPQASVKQLIDLAMREAEELYRQAAEAFAGTAVKRRKVG